MHHELFDISNFGGKGSGMMPFMESQANEIMNVLDRAIANTRIEGKRLGII